VRNDGALVLVSPFPKRRAGPTTKQRAMVAARLKTMKQGGNRKSDQDANLHLDRADAATKERCADSL